MRPELISQPITGICSFGRYPICLDLDQLDADFGVLGVPFDMGVGFLSGARMGPRRVREASTQYGRGTQGYYDYEADEQLLAAPGQHRRLRRRRCAPGDRDYSFHCIERAVRRIIRAGTIPIVIGGDHSISIPVGRALEEYTKRSASFNLTPIWIGPAMWDRWFRETAAPCEECLRWNTLDQWCRSD